MRIISEKRLLELRLSCDSPLLSKFLEFLIEAECTELNAWQPIETAPTGRPILIVFKNGLYEVGELNINGVWRCNVGIDYDYEDTPTHWQELPDDPK